MKKTIKYGINEENPNVAVFDRDFKEEFIDGINLAKKNNIYPAYSNQSFNLFLILHKKYLYKPTTKENNYEKELKEVYNLDKNSDIKNEDTINTILKQKEIATNIYDEPYLNVSNFLEEVLNEIKK